VIDAMTLSSLTERRLRDLAARGARPRGPEAMDRPPGWRCVVELPDGRSVEGRGVSDAEAAESALVKAEAVLGRQAEAAPPPGGPETAPVGPDEPPPGTVPGGQRAGAATGADPPPAEDAPG
jgi:hypothetical protein